MVPKSGFTIPTVLVVFSRRTSKGIKVQILYKIKN
jgi:hypothetical protein